MKKWPILLLCVCVVLGLGLSKAQAVPFTKGDVFAAIGSGQVKEFTPTGTLVQTLNDTTNSTFTTGMAFDASGNLYVTNFSLGSVSKLDNSGNVVNANFITGLTNPESILFDKSGNIYVGDAGSNLIHKYNSTGTLLNTFTVAIENRGTDWIDLAKDQQTMLYTSEGKLVKSFNVSTSTQNADFAINLTGSNAFALRILPDGTVLVADSANPLLLNAAGAIIITYGLPGNSGGDFSLNLDPNGVDFWTGDDSSHNVWEVNIATGKIDNQWNVGSGQFFGLAVFGEVTAGGGGTVPEPATILLLGSGLLGLAGYARKRMKK